MSPTQRSLAKLRSEGWQAFVVEKWNQWARIRQDLGGFGDVIAWKPGCGVIIVQATSGSNVSSRVNKMIRLQPAGQWLQAGSNLRLEVWGWRKVGKRGERKVWQVKTVKLALNGLGILVEQE